MKLWSLALAAGTLLPSALVAQHTVAPAPPVVAAVSHVSSPTPSASIHASSVPSSRTPGAPSLAGGQGTHTTSQPARDQQATSVKFDERSHAAAKSTFERRGLLSFLRKREPISSDSRNNCKNGSCLAKRTMPPVPSAAPARTEARIGCNVVPVNNPGVPCNPLAPCCP